MLQSYFTISVLLQLCHFTEELCTGFHRKSPLAMPLHIFLILEAIFEGFWVWMIFAPDFMYKEYLQAFFLVLMFANGVWHVTWFAFFERCKKYVSGIVTGVLHIVLFLYFYFSFLF